MHKNIRNWLALLRTRGLGPVHFHKLLQNDPFLDNLPTIAKDTLSSCKQLIDQDLLWAAQNDCHIMLFCDDDYPKLLRNIHAPPPILFIRGKRRLLDKPQIAIVGSREASNIGVQTAFKFGKELSGHNIVVTSGLAAGIDAAGHKGA